MGFDINYEFALSGILTDNWKLARQSLLLLVAWSHVVIGLHFFLRLFLLVPGTGNYICTRFRYCCHYW